MSGVKEARIAFSNWWNRQITEPLTRSLEPRMEELIRERTRTELDGELGSVRERQAAVEALVEKLGDRNREHERETAQRLEQHAQRLAEQVHTTRDELRAELYEAIAGSEEALRTELDAERDERRAETRRLQGGLDALTADKDRAREAAAAALADARVMQEIVAALPHERYAPGELAPLARRVQEAEEHLAEGRPEAAVVKAQDTFDALTRLRVDVELRRSEWLVLRAAALEGLVVLDERIRLNASSSVIDEHGEAVAEARFEVDHWSDGALGELRDDVSRLTTAVRAGDELTLDELREIVRAQVPALEGRLGEVVETARRRVVASQLRANVADLVAEALEGGFAYHTEQWTYADDDDREAVYARLRHLSGNEIVIEVAPVGADPAESDLRILSFDRDTGSANQRDARMAAITAYLLSRDVPMGDAREGGEPDPGSVPEKLWRDEGPAPAPAPAPGPATGGPA